MTRRATRYAPGICQRRQQTFFRVGGFHVPSMIDGALSFGQYEGRRIGRARGSNVAGLPNQQLRESLEHR